MDKLEGRSVEVLALALSILSAPGLEVLRTQSVANTRVIRPYCRRQVLKCCVASRLEMLECLVRGLRKTSVRCNHPAEKLIDVLLTC